MENQISELILSYPLLLFSLSFHEAAHGFVADKFGDSTARLLGRVSLSPLPHIDIVGTVILPIAGILWGMPVIGWGKPVPVNPYRLKGDIRRSSLWVSAAGPLSNVALALVFAALANLIFHSLPHLPRSLVIPGSGGAFTTKIIFTICAKGTVLNLILACFNLLPLPPLDGGTVLRGLLPESSLEAFDQFSRYGFIILIFLFATTLLNYVFVPVKILASYLLPMISFNGF